MASKKISRSGIFLGMFLILLGLGHSVYIYLNPDQGSGNAFYTIGFLLVVGFYFISKGKAGKGAKELATKEDIGKYTLTPSFEFKHYLILLFAIALIFAVFIILGPMFEGKSIIP